MVDLTFTAPTRPLSINETTTMHWAARKRHLEPWADAVVLAWRGLKRSEQARVKGKRCKVLVTLSFETNRRRDPHNYTGTVVKKIIDALVREGVWEDDTPEWVVVIEPELVVKQDCHVRLEPTCT